MRKAGMILYSLCVYLLPVIKADAQGSAERLILPALTKEDSLRSGYVRLYARYIKELPPDKAAELRFVSNVLARHGIPESLKNLAIIESHLNRTAVSEAGAKGPWQFMPDEARSYGLQLSPVDERTDLYKSTFAAARMLQDLYRRYHDWLLVVAAYNGGSGRMDKAIAASHSKDPGVLIALMPAETQEHIRRFQAVSLLTAPSSRPVIDTGAIRAVVAAQAPVASGLPEYHGALLSIPLTAGYNPALIISELRMEAATFFRVNDCLVEELAVKGHSTLLLPKDKMALFLALKDKILEKSLTADTAFNSPFN